MLVTFYPVILGCVSDKCKAFVPDGLLSLMNEEACNLVLNQGLEILKTANPGVMFIGRCISWSVGV